MAGTEANTKTPKGQTGEGQPEKARASGSPESPRTNLVAFTIDANAGRIVKVEKVDNAGARRDLSDEDAAMLTKGNPLTLEMIIEQAFEAGIACVLGDEAAQDDVQETEDDAALSRLLLMPLMERTPAHSLQQREVLGRAMLASAIEQAIGHRRGESGLAPRQEAGSTGKSRPSVQPGPARER
jgi:hypothetical protein